MIVNLEDVRGTQERPLVASRAVAPGDVALAVWTEIAREHFLVPSQVLERSRFSAAEIAAALHRLAEHGEIFLSQDVAVKMLVWRDLLERAANLIDTFHKKHPERRGLELSELRCELSSISAAVFEELTQDLCQKGFIRAGSTIARSSHRPALPRQLQSAAEKIRAALSAKPSDPPSRKELTKDPSQQQALKFLIEQGEIVEISEEIVLLRDGFDQMQTTVCKFVSTNGPATASQLREELKTSRRIIIPFLEYLDRLGITRRDGDLRILREAKSRVIARQ